MTYDTDALVIKAQNTGETDRLVTLLTRKYGVIRAFANGARSPKNKNASATSLLCYADFTITKTAKGICIVKESTPKEVFFSLRSDIIRLSLRSDIIRLSLAQYFAELSGELAPREESADEFLSLLLNAVYLVTKKKKPLQLMKAATELRMLSLAGYMPSLLGCASCGAYETEEMRFCTHSGKLFCSDCTPQEVFVPVPNSVVHAMRHICLSEPNKLFSFRLSDENLLLLGDLSERYLLALTGKRFATLQFYKTMTR